LFPEIFGIIQDVDHTASEAKTMKNGLLTIGTILALMCVGQAKDKLTQTTRTSKLKPLGRWAECVPVTARQIHPIKRTSISTLLAFATLAVTTAHAGVLDDWGKPALLKQFFMQYRIKFHQQGTIITSITLDRKGKASGNAYFHGGECYALMLTVARGPGSRVNFDKDVTTTAMENRDSRKSRKEGSSNLIDLDSTSGLRRTSSLRILAAKRNYVSKSFHTRKACPQWSQHVYQCPLSSSQTAPEWLSRVSFETRSDFFQQRRRERAHIEP
jgi:hypothetical protein